MKRVFGTVEAIFDIFYLGAAMSIGSVLLVTASGNSARALSGVMALSLAIGDAFHLVPRIIVIRTSRQEQLRRSLGYGKMVTSITMTLFYLLLWRIGLLAFSPQDTALWSYAVHTLAAVRIILCLLPQNRWPERYPPASWAIARNIPFFLQGAVVTGLFLAQRNVRPELGRVWLACVLSFVFYIPVVVWANKYPKIGILMLPKSLAYLWLLTMCLSL